MKKNKKKVLFTIFAAILIYYGVYVYFNILGVVNGKSGHYDKAIDEISIAILLNPFNAPAYNNRGNAYRHKEAFDKALEDYNKAIELDQNYEIAYNNRGNLYKAKGEYDKALADYKKSIELNPKYAAGYSSLGEFYRNRGQYEEALQNFTKSIELNPKEDIAYFNRGFLYLETDKNDDAVKDIDYAFRITHLTKERLLEIANQADNIALSQYFSLKNRPEDACLFFRQAINKGYVDREYIKKHNAFNNIRNSSCYKEIMLEK